MADAAPPLADWQQAFIDQVRKQRATQVTPFQSIIGTYATTRQQLAEAQEEITRLKTELSNANATRIAVEERLTKAEYALKGVTIKSGREQELEATNAALTEQMRSVLKTTQDYIEIKQKHQELENAYANVSMERNNLSRTLKETAAALADRENSVVLLKQEVGALQDEVSIQRQKFAATIEENNRLLPMVMQAKEKEAQYMDQILELEQQLAALLKGGKLEDKAEKDRTFLDQGTASLPSFASSFAKPSYVAHLTDNCHETDVSAMTITENGKWIWTGGTDRILKSWDSTNANPGGKVSVGATILCLDSCGDTLVAGCADAGCRVFDMGTLRGRCQLTGHSEKITASYLSADRTKVFTASSDRSLRIWDILRGGALLSTTLCFSAVNDLAVSNDRICSAHYDTTLRFWDVKSGKTCAEIAKAHEKTVTSVRFAKDGFRLVSLSRDNTIKMFDIRMMQEVFTLSSPALTISSNVTRVTLSPDDRFAAVGTSAGSVLVFDLVPSGKASELKGGHKEGMSVPVVCWSPDGRGLASVGSDKRLVFWR